MTEIVKKDRFNGASNYGRYGDDQYDLAVVRKLQATCLVTARRLVGTTHRQILDCHHSFSIGMAVSNSVHFMKRPCG